ncbi:hypothetical protein Cadr_000013222 [Camelus dromedarius]|uniref:Uncharacterized protein n=1 Tax=Camelus dromedarius TaxID=9838 RepID=A0A5N4DB02_CAMDR|nr:hypothetical protein Cadr_000013222 [Camelus dromedarius]
MDRDKTGGSGRLPQPGPGLRLCPPPSSECSPPPAPGSDPRVGDIAPSRDSGGLGYSSEQDGFGPCPLGMARTGLWEEVTLMLRPGWGIGRALRGKESFPGSRTAVQRGCNMLKKHKWFLRGKSRRPGLALGGPSLRSGCLRSLCSHHSAAGEGPHLPVAATSSQTLSPPLTWSVPTSAALRGPSPVAVTNFPTAPLTWKEGTSPSPGDTICQGAGRLALRENLRDDYHLNWLPLILQQPTLCSADRGAEPQPWAHLQMLALPLSWIKPRAMMGERSLAVDIGVGWWHRWRWRWRWRWSLRWGGRWRSHGEVEPVWGYGSGTPCDWWGHAGDDNGGHRRGDNDHGATRVNSHIYPSVPPPMVNSEGISVQDAPALPPILRTDLAHKAGLWGTTDGFPLFWPRAGGTTGKGLQQDLPIPPPSQRMLPTDPAWWPQAGWPRIPLSPASSSPGMLWGFSWNRPTPTPCQGQKGLPGRALQRLGQTQGPQLEKGLVSGKDALKLSLRNLITSHLPLLSKGCLQRRAEGPNGIPHLMGSERQGPIRMGLGPSTDVSRNFRIILGFVCLCSGSRHGFFLQAPRDGGRICSGSESGVGFDAQACGKGAGDVARAASKLGGALRAPL